MPPKSKSLTQSFRILDQRYHFYRAPRPVRFHGKRITYSRFLTPLKINNVRRKSCEGRLFGIEKHKKAWMHLVTMEHPQQRRVNLAKSVYDKLKVKKGRSRLNSLRKCLKDQVQLLKTLSQIMIIEDQKKESPNSPLKKSTHIQLAKIEPRKPRVELFPLTKKIEVPQPLLRRNFSQPDLVKDSKPSIHSSISPDLYYDRKSSVYSVSNTPSQIQIRKGRSISRIYGLIK